MALNSGPGVYLFPVIFHYGQGRRLLVDSLAVCDARGEFWWQLMMLNALYCILILLQCTLPLSLTRPGTYMKPAII